MAAGAAVVIGELLAGLFSPSLSPLTAVGGAVIDAVPPGVKDWAISLFGTADKAVFVGGMLLVIAAVGALAGILEQRRRFAGGAVIAVFGLVGLSAVLTRAQMTPAAAVVALAAALSGALQLGWLIRRLHEGHPAGAAGTGAAGTAAGTNAATAQVPAGTAAGTNAATAQVPAGTAATAGRRTFLQVLAASAGATAVGGVVAAVWRGAASGISTAREMLQLPAAVSGAPAIPAGAEVGLDGMQPLVTPNRDFYRIDTALIVPSLDPESWVLRVTGMVEQEIELNLADLLAKPLIERHVTIACVSNEVGGDLIGNARWLGWPVRELLALARPQSGADMVLSRSSDGWTAGTPLEVLTDQRDALLAVGMNGEPLPLEHGFPVRLIVPGLYGYVSATKWLTELRLTRFADDVGYWTPRGWSDRGPIKTSSRIDVPRTGRRVGAGTVMFGGVAWAQHTGVGKVELRVNRGPWQAARLAPGISLDTWYQWQLGIDLAPGQYEVQVRATDLNGEPQVEDRRPVAPDGATGFHTIRVDVNP
ncbi:molybdopterin-dependent oxidoreductase [Pseudarthrobacter sp. MDT3-28]|uniref:molybdopterin-dependent oxidoreductase n=1 Tax=Pseudarthrobacter raffinosi TaxID=2953651 RepID=UPI00208EAAB0|nr:molybdopterin-dependent oxidoreductase [Pseudarthrobacter sp. MDT3-28]MCO4237772.1 molybdopterin-dependent oxidoreductase [Pseudarthrobacter sp. MDT3-28]